jgi:small-conductance mechanosensitive channel
MLLFLAPRAFGENAAPVVVAAPVRVHEREVYVVRVAREKQSPADRARAASQALDAVLEEEGEVEARAERQGQTATVFVGKTPILTLTDDDAASAGDATLDLHAAAVATRVTEALRTERKRSAIATQVFSFSLLVFSALIAFLLFRRVGDVSARARAWIDKNPDRIPALRLGTIEVVSSSMIRGALVVALVVGHRLAQIAIAYGWLLAALSLFESTRGYTERLTGFVLTPLSALLGRVGSALPMLVVTLVAALAVWLLVRFVRLFFGGVARGETKLGWLPADLAEPTSVVVSAGIVIVSLIVAAPLITGSDEGALTRAGVAALVALGLACTPVLACAAAGVPQVFGRKLRPGEFAEMGGRAGRVRKVTLLEVELEDPLGCELRVPHLMTLVRPTRIVGKAPLVTVDVAVDPRAPQGSVHETLLAAAKSTSGRAKVELVSIDEGAARWRVTCEDATAVAGALSEALSSIALGREGRA